jgi:DNA-binding LacI/PurR family transcriptional regulator
MPVTIHDVARRAGVSIRTVSRAVNRKEGISEATRQRVLAIVEEMNYRPNTLARGLVSGKSQSVAIIIPQITDPFYPEFILGVESIARAQGYSVLLCNTNEIPEQELEYIKTMAAKQVEGFILCGTRLNSEQLEQLTLQHNVAMVTSRNLRSATVVRVPGEAGLFTTTSHLISLGHRAIGFIGYKELPGENRVDGYKRALETHAIPLNEQRIVDTPSVSIEEGYNAATKLLAQMPDTTAIACWNDLMAIGALQACRELGRRVPEDIALVGFDDIPIASLITPRLTTLHVSRHRLGEMVMNLLHKVIMSGGEYAEETYIPTNLIIRESSGSYITAK